MSIKKDNVNVTAVIYNNQDVNKVILDNNCVWCRPFTYTQGTLPTGVESLVCRRSSTDEPSASTGEISNNGTIYYYDKLYWEATASTGYRITAVKGSGSPVTVSGAITGTTASGLTSERISGTISQGTLPAGVASITCYRKAYNENSFSEYTGSTIYYGDQFYWTATAATEYNNPSLTYNNSSKVYTWTGSQNGSINSVSASELSAGTRKSFTISFGTTANKSLYGSWSSSSQTAYYGDKITVSGNSVICYKWDNNSTTRWTVTVSASSNTAEYTYSAVTIAESSIASVTAAATFTAYNTRTLNSYTITWKYMSAYGSWTTATESYNYSATPSRTLPDTVYSSNKRYVSLNWDDLGQVTGNRTITCNYKHQIYYDYNETRCKYRSGTTAGWYDGTSLSYSTTFTSDSGYAFNNSGLRTMTFSGTTEGGVIYPNASYIKITASSSNTNGFLSTNSAAISGSTTLWVTSGTTVYAYAKLKSFVSSVPSTWQLKDGTALCPNALYLVSSDAYKYPGIREYSATITTNSFWCAHRNTTYDSYSTSQTFNAARWNGRYYSVNDSFNVFTTHGLEKSSRIWSQSGTYPNYYTFNINGPSSVTFKAEFSVSMSGLTYETPTCVLYRVSTDGTMTSSDMGIMGNGNTQSLTTDYLWVLTMERPEGKEDTTTT